jgi:AhpD family alkylhydroperoxidase
MKPRIQTDKVAPEAYQAVLALEKYVRANVDHKLLELIKLRASFINGCAYCIDMHSSDALRAGESSRRLFAVAAFRESPFFTDAERAALELTDAVTNIKDGGVPDHVWEAARKIWSEKQVTDLVMAICAINTWNRVAIAAHAVAPPDPHTA